MNFLSPIRQLIATFLYVFLDIFASVVQFILLGLPLLISYFAAQIFPFTQELKIIVFVCGFVAIFFVYEWLKDNGKAIDAKVRAKTKRFILYIGGKDFLLK